MKTRILTALVGLAVFIPVLWFSEYLVLEVLFAVVSVFAAYEIIHCVGQQRNLAVMIPSFVIAAFVPLTVRQINIVESWGMGFGDLLLALFIPYMLLLLSFSVFSKGEFPINSAALIFTAVFYIVVGFTGIVQIRSVPGGEYLFLLVFVASWIPDMGAYFVGVNFGRHKLIPDVSPKKSIEGAIGGIVTCMLSFAVYTVAVNHFFDVELNIWLMLVASVLLAVVSMVGDLIASLIKRHYGIKDYGRILPGHGGVMDRFDSALAVSCVMYVLILIPAFANNILKITAA